jgi:hypothetical protein
MRAEICQICAPFAKRCSPKKTFILHANVDEIDPECKTTIFLASFHTKDRRSQWEQE